MIRTPIQMMQQQTQSLMTSQIGSTANQATPNNEVNRKRHIASMPNSGHQMTPTPSNTSLALQNQQADSLSRSHSNKTM